MLTSFADANAVLATFIPPAGTLHMAYTLTRMRELMAALGNPQDSLRVIHVAGTSGKTSTCYYVASLLKAAGQRVGLTVSPHITQVNERVQLDLQPMPEAEFCHELELFLDMVKKTGVQPTYFELLVAFAYWVFAKAGVDYAVVEVGLGGLSDGTNVVHSRDKVCIITDIGYDHMHVLGNTLEKIASQKAGIVHQGNHIFAYKQSPEIHAVLQRRAAEKEAALNIVRTGTSRKLPDDMAMFQSRNWFLAHAVYEFLRQRNDLPRLSRNQLIASARAQIPARMEVLQLGDKTIVLDGAHNAQKMRALAVSLRNLFPDEPIACLFAFVKHRNDRLHATLEQLIWIASHLTVTSFTLEQELSKTSLPPAAVLRVCNELGFDDIDAEPDTEKALRSILARPERVLLITGSFYLIGRLRPLLIRETRGD